MKRVHIIGRKNSGKTTLIAELVTEFRSRGLNVGTIKHTHHQHELDSPGKDSHRHREAGAAVVGILSKSMSAAFWPTTVLETDSNPESRYLSFAPTFADCEIVLVEGDTHTTAPKLEVWRAENQSELIRDSIPEICAVVSDDPVEGTTTILPRSDIRSVADFILQLVESME